jgi:hypothetical protein
MISSGDGVQIIRQFVYRTLKKITLQTTLGATPEIPMGQWSSGSIYIPVGSPITTLTFFGAPRAQADPDPDTPAPLPNPPPTYYALFTGAGAAVTLTVAAGNCYTLPPDCNSLGALKITANVAGQVELVLKS